MLYGGDVLLLDDVVDGVGSWLDGRTVEEIFHYYFVRYTLISVDMNFIMKNMGKRIEDVVGIALKEEQK